ncbi:MAG: PASTA domain-containing protein, partial [Gemmatimonadetes bacterium]|nr:PASTA domain-containing protein [Gemmatimonadota bacterium]NIS34969.1 PASTA domain-containing protein [Actinomycetota bacterium]NIT97845.1 PASTA domain-containing protein [Actinomycetota bacterium]NIU69705.1 PASTA domain-containing protein [Actinomycetota bacterium]NIV89557.1 PASTA domain-containing protein [Actinomycetota bacterium]
MRWIASADVPEGVISAQAPAAGTEVDAATRVDITVSAGGPVIRWADLPPMLR